MASCRTKKHVLLTGSPGIGKTTLIQSICHSLREKGVTLAGFYTQELRQERGGGRTGFDVVTLDGHKAPLARLNNNGSRGLHHDARAPPVVGRYTVDIPSFETCVLPILTGSSSNPQVTVLDEIGKMELFSRPFATAVKKIFDQSSSVVLATVPLSKGRGLPLVEEIKKRPDCALTEVTVSNRGYLSEALTKQIIGTIKELKN